MKHLFRFFCSGRTGVSAAASATTAAAPTAPTAPSTAAPPPIAGPTVAPNIAAARAATAGELGKESVGVAETGGCDTGATWTLGAPATTVRGEGTTAAEGVPDTAGGCVSVSTAIGVGCGATVVAIGTGGGVACAGSTALGEKLDWADDPSSVVAVGGSWSMAFANGGNEFALADSWCRETFGGYGDIGRHKWRDWEGYSTCED